MVITKNILILYIYKNKLNLINELEFKKLIISSRIKYVKYYKLHIRYINKKYFIGIGNIYILKKKIIKYKIYKLIINKVFKNIQEYNLGKILNCKIINKINLILLIFKNRALTNYGKLQVKLSYLSYLNTRLIKRWSHLERQKGGLKYISGPGEKQIEIDRRIIKKKISKLKLNLQKNINQRYRRNKLRNKYNIPTISLVGYTNSGKSTLFNLLTYSNIKCENKYFTTLDTYIRKIKIFKFYYDILLSDTIGFIKNLPKNIILGFKGTLDEINNSKLIFHVVDVSNIYFNNYINIVNNILYDVNIFKIPIILIMNKIDKIDNFIPKVDYNDNKLPFRIWISAKKKIGINLVKSIINFYFFNDYKKYNINFPMNLIFLVKKYIYNKKILILKEWSNNGIIYNIEIISNKIYIDNLIKKYKLINIK